MRRLIVTGLFRLALRIDTEWALRLANACPEVDWTAVRGAVTEQERQAIRRQVESG